MSRARRLAIHVGSREWGGAERQLLRLAGALHAAGVEVVAFCNQPGHAERFRAAGVPAELARLGGDIAVSDALRFALRLRRWRPDVLLVGTYKKLWLAGLAGRLAGVPRVIARIGLQTDVPRSRKYHFALRRLVDELVLNAREQAAPFLVLPGWDERRVHVIYNYYRPPPPGTPGRVRAELGIPAEVRVAGAVARLARQKRLERLVEAAALVAELHAILAGDGPERARLEALATALGAADRIHFLGEREDVADVLAALDVFVICSDREGMSNAMLEALAAGVPVVSTPVSGAREALDPQPDGCAPGVISGPAPAALSAAIAAVVADGATQRAMAAAARARFRERFAPEPVLEQWLRVIAGGGPREEGR